MTTEQLLSSYYGSLLRRKRNLSIGRERYPLQHLSLDQMQITMLSEDGEDGQSFVRSNKHHCIQIKQEPEEISDDCCSNGEDKDFGDKWGPMNNDKSDNIGFTNDFEDSQHPHHHHHHSHIHNYNSYHSSSSPQPTAFSSSIVNRGEDQSFQNQQCSSSSPRVDEASLDSQDNPEGSSSTSVVGGAQSPSTITQSTKESTSFLFVGPLGKKRKYSRQRATSDDNESECHPPTGAGSPETPEEMDQVGQHSSPGESSQSSNTGRPTSKESAVSSDQGLFEPVSTIVANIPAQHLDSGGESNSENSREVKEEEMPTIISKPLPMIGAPTSVIRRAGRKKQENPLPLNLSVSSPPGTSSHSCSSSPISSGLNTVSSSGRPMVVERSNAGNNPSVIREELYFDTRSNAPDNRPLFIWRYRDDAPGAPPPYSPSSAIGPMSPVGSTVSAASFAVPEVREGGSGGSSGASNASNVSQRTAASQYPSAQASTSRASGGTTSGKAPKKKLTCNDCGKEFSQLRNYRYHRSRHEGSNQFSCTCPVCGKQFNDRGYLSSHMKIHRNAKEYRCEYCSKGFNQRVAYNMHRRIHTGHRPHQCEICGKSFSRRMLLKQHMRIHTGERPYSCGVCSKAFADRSNMLLHQRLHSGERPYVCEICKKSFSKNHHLKTHMNHHAGIKPYECPKCHARFSQSSNMKTHLKKCSGIPNPTTTQRQQMLRRNPLDIGRPTAQLPSLPSLSGVVAAAAAAAAARGAEVLPPLSAASRLIYEQQSLNLLSQSISGGALAPVPAHQLSPGHSRGQVPIENLLLHLNVSRSRHPSQGSGSGSPTTSVSIPDLQLMLRNAAAAAASGSRSAPGQPHHYGQRSNSNPSSPGSSSNLGGNVIPGMSNFLGVGVNPNTVGRHASAAHLGSNSADPVPTSTASLGINPNVALAGYGMSSGGERSHGTYDPVDSNAMPPPTSGSVLRNVTPGSLIPPELLSPQSAANLLRIDTRGMDGHHSGASPPDRSSSQGQARVVPSPLTSPRRMPPSPQSSLSSGGQMIPLNSLEQAAIASGLRMPSQMARLLSTALRENAANAAAFQNSQPSSYQRLPSISHQNVLEAMVAAAAEQTAAATQSSYSRIRQVTAPSQPQRQQYHQVLHPSLSSQAPFIYEGESDNLSTMSHHSSQHGTAPPNQNPYSVITSTQQVQQQSHSIPQHSSHSHHRYSTSGSTTSTSRVIIEEQLHHVSSSPDQHLQQQVDLAYHSNPSLPQPQSQQRQHGYHQSLLLSHVSQNQPASQQSSSGYSSSAGAQGNIGNSSSNSSNYPLFAHSVVRSRSQSPNSDDHHRDPNQDYQN